MIDIIEARLEIVKVDPNKPLSVGTLLRSRTNANKFVQVAKNTSAYKSAGSSVLISRSDLSVASQYDPIEIAMFDTNGKLLATHEQILGTNVNCTLINVDSSGRSANNFNDEAIGRIFQNEGICHLEVIRNGDDLKLRMNDGKIFIQFYANSPYSATDTYNKLKVGHK